VTPAPGGSVRLAALLLAALATGCASRGPVPGTGDIAFRLTWDGAADLDLYVVDPIGDRVDFFFRTVPSGGTLDIDCNVTVATPRDEEGGAAAVEYRKLRCPQPIENVYWPTGRAPEGIFRVQVVLADGEGATPSDRYRLDVRLGRRTHRSFEGGVGSLAEAPLAVEVTYPLEAADGAPTAGH
jgi:hypothetical protein